MWKRSSLLCALLVFAAVTSSCIFDANEGDGDDIVDSDYQPLTTKVAVLNNLEVAYNQRKILEYEKILDLGFTFFLSEGDVNGGLPVQWDRGEEISANTNLFSRDEDPQGRWPLCTSIQMNVIFDPASIQWVEVIPDAAPDETWYTTTLFYEFQIDVKPDTQFIPIPGAKAQFTVRNAGTESNPKWQLIEWRDLGAGT
jgi:hypothetical protein